MNSHCCTPSSALLRHSRPSKAGRRALIDFFLTRKAHAPELDTDSARDSLASVTKFQDPAAKGRDKATKGVPVGATKARRVSSARMLRNWGIVYAGNLVGAVGQTPVSDPHTAGPDLGSQHLVTHVEDRVLHVRIDRVEYRNAFTQDMYRGLKRAAIWADRQPELDAVCLTGTGDWFGAGGDLAGRKEDPDGLAAEWDGTDHFPFRHIERCRKLWVAKINGVCHAGGLDLGRHLHIPERAERGAVTKCNRCVDL